MQRNGIDPLGPAVVLTLDNGTQVTADKVVVAVGLEPNTALAISGRLETDPINQGFVVNSELQARNSVWVVRTARHFCPPPFPCFGSVHCASLIPV